MSESNLGAAYIRPSWPAWLWRGGDVELFVALPPDLALARIAAAVGPRMLAVFSSRPLVGRFDPTGSLVVRANTRLFNNSWASLLDASVRPYRDGSVISGQFRLNRVVLAFSIVWFGLAALIGFVGAVGSAVSRSDPSVTLTALILPCFFLAILTIGRLLALISEKKVLRVLARLGDAASP